MKNVYKEQQHQQWLVLVGEIPNFICLVIALAATTSLTVCLDLIDSFTLILHDAFILFLTYRLQNNTKYEYNYGVGKIDALASLCCDSVLMMSVLISFVFSISQIITPEQPSGLLIAVVPLKVINVSVDLFMYWNQRKIFKKEYNRLVESELVIQRKELFFDSAVLIGLIGSYICIDFKPGWYISPVLCLCLGIYLMLQSVGHIKDSINELMDKTVDEDAQMLILQALASCRGSYRKFNEVRSRISGGTVYVDLLLSFSDGTSYAQMKEMVNNVFDKIKHKYPKSVVSIIISNDAKQPAKEEN